MRLLFVLFLFVFSTIQSFAQRYEWIKTFGSNGTSGSEREVVVSGNNVIVAGDFQNSISFGTTVLTAGNSSSTSNIRNIYIANYDTLGTVKWAIKGGSANGVETFRNATVDDFGNIYVTGTFNQQMTWGTLTLGITGTGGSFFRQEGFIVKISPTGTPLWIRGVYSNAGSFGFNGVDLLSASDSSLYVGGSFRETLSFTGSTSTVSSVTLGGFLQNSAYIARYDLNGNLQSANRVAQATSTSVQLQPSELKAISNNSYYLVGNYSSNVSFGTNGQTFTSPNTAIIISKYTGGNCDWALPGVSANSFFSFFNPQIEIDKNDDLIIGGTFRNSIQFQTTNITASTANGINWFVGKVAPNGSVIDLQSLPVTSTTLNDVAVSNANEIMLAGSYTDSVDINGLKTFSNGGADFLMTLLDSNFNVNWYQTGGGGNFDVANGVEPIGNSDFIVLGNYNGLSQFGSTVISGGVGFNNGIIFKMSECGTTSIPIVFNGDTNLCAGGNVRIVAAPTSSSTFQWLRNDLSLSGEFFRDLLVNTSGNYSVIVNGAGCVDTSRNIPVAVGTPPVVTLTLVDTVCLFQTPITLSGGTPSGGTYKGAGVSGNTFDPSIAGIGDALITYVVDNGGCSDSSNTTIFVKPAPTVFFAPIPSICENSTTITLGNAFPMGGTFSGVGVNGNQFDPAVSGSGTFPITYTYSDGSGCNSSTVQNITVDSIETVSFSALSSVCENSSPFILSGGQPLGGIYSGIGVTNGSFDPAQAGAGTFNIQYIVSNQCGNDTAAQSITVLPQSSVSLGVFADVCENSGVISLSGGTPAGGTYSGVGVSNGTFDPTTAGIGTNQIFYTVTNSNGCKSLDSSSITVNALPSISISNDTAICIGDTVSLSASGGSSYSWSNGATNSSISVSPIATITYNVTVNNSVNCISNASVTVTVNSLPTANIAGNTTICEGETTILTATGGSSYLWSNGSLNDSINISPTATTNYSVTVINANGCADISSETVIVNPLPAVSLNAFPTICEDAGLFTLTGGSPAGGTYSGTGVSNGILNPSVSGSGTIPIVYEVINTNGCVARDTANIQVNSLPVPNITQDTSICVGAVVALSASGGSNYIWSNGSTNNSISVSPTNTTTYFVTVSDASACSVVDSVTVTVNQLPTALITGATNICQNTSTILTASGGTNYLWNNGDSAATINVSPSNTTNYSVTVTNNSGCADTSTTTVTVTPGPSVNYNTITSVCEGSPSFQLSGGSPAGGTYSGIGVNNGLFNPSASGAGNFVITYTVTDNNGCSASDSSNITVNAFPNLTVSNDTVICEGESVTLQASGGTSYTWRANGVTSNFTSAALPVSPISTTTYLISTTNNGCSSTDSVTVVVNSKPQLSVSNDTSICLGDSVQLTANFSFLNTFNWNTGSTSPSITVAPLQTTNYIAQSQSAFSGCIATDTVTIAVSTSTPISIGNDTLLNSNTATSVTFDAGPGFSSYLWSDGSFGQTLTVNYDITKAGLSETFFVVVSNGIGCPSVDSATVTYDFSTGISSGNNPDNNIKVYPNPTNNELFVTWNQSQEIEMIQLFDVKGKLVYSKNVTNESEQLKLELKNEGISKGVYFIRFFGDESSETKKIVVQ